jgi:hypothetical protein
VQKDGRRAQISSVGHKLADEQELIKKCQISFSVFEYTIFAMILINTLSLAMKFYQQPELYTQFLDVLNVIFTVFFTMEFVLKLGAFRFKVKHDLHFFNVFFKPGTTTLEKKNYQLSPFQGACANSEPNEMQKTDYT